MADLHSYKTAFEPIGLPRETLHLIKTDEELDVEIVSVGALPWYQHNFGAQTAATWSLNNEATPLEVSSMELAQYRIIVLDDYQLYLKNPSGVEQWRSSRQRFFLPQFPTDPDATWMQEFLFKMSEFFVWENDNTPRWDIYPPVTLTRASVVFTGWRYKVKRATVRGKTDVWVNGWGSIKG